MNMLLLDTYATLHLLRHYAFMPPRHFLPRACHVIRFIDISDYISPRLRRYRRCRFIYGRSMSRHYDATRSLSLLPRRYADTTYADTRPALYALRRVAYGTPRQRRHARLLPSPLRYDATPALLFSAMLILRHASCYADNMAAIVAADAMLR